MSAQSPVKQMVSKAETLLEKAHDAGLLQRTEECEKYATEFQDAVLKLAENNYREEALALSGKATRSVISTLQDVGANTFCLIYGNGVTPEQVLRKASDIRDEMDNTRLSGTDPFTGQDWNHHESIKSGACVLLAGTAAYALCIVLGIQNMTFKEAGVKIKHDLYSVLPHTSDSSPTIQPSR